MSKILDPCCGSRMMWFDKQDNRAVFGDIRAENHTLCDGRSLSIEPDMHVDFRSMPFDSCSFKLVVFDPPHFDWFINENDFGAGGLEAGHNKQMIQVKSLADLFNVIEMSQTP